MKKIIVIAILILTASLLLSGCTGTFFGSNKEAPITSTNVYTGTNGIEIEFLKNTPPDKIFEGEIFQVSTDIKNKGAYPINHGKVVLTSEIDYVKATSTTDSFNLKGKDMYDPQDHDVLKNFFLTAYTLDAKSIERQSIVLLTVCYDYGTKLNTDVCIDTDPYNQKIVEKPCQVSDQTFSGQGAPISVTKIETKMMVSEQNSIRPQFLIYLRNDGNGQVISKNSIDKACGSSQITKDELNGVTLKDLRFSEYTLSDMDCQPSVLRFVDKDVYFVCTLKPEKAITSDTTSFKTNLYVELEYGYTTTKSKEFTIKKINTIS